MSVFLTRLTVPQIEVEAKLTIGEVSQIGRVILFDRRGELRIGIRSGSRLVRSGEFFCIELIADVHNVEALGGREHIAERSDRRVNTRIVAAQVDAVFGKIQRQGVGIDRLICVGCFGKGIVVIYAAACCDLQSAGELCKALEIRSIYRVLLNIKDRGNICDIGEGVLAAALGHGHALCQVGTQQIEAVVKIFHVHIGNMGLIGIDTNLSRFGAVYRFTQDGDRLDRVDL